MTPAFAEGKCHQEPVSNCLSIEADLAELGTVEQFPKMEGCQPIMVLAPNTKKKGGSQAAKDEPEAVAEAEAYFGALSETIVPRPCRRKRLTPAGTDVTTALNCGVAKMPKLKSNSVLPF